QAVAARRTVTGSGADHHSADIRDHRGTASPGRDHLSGRAECQSGTEAGRPGLCDGARAYRHAGQRRAIAGRSPGAPGLSRWLSGHTTLITTAIQALTITHQHRIEVVIVAGTALDAAGGIEPEFQALVMHPAKTQGTVG